MCGCYASINGSIKDCLSALDILKSRGADSAGIAFGSGLGGWIIHKTLGHSFQFASINKHNVELNVGPIISHCRWSTHGAVTLNNTHPITSFDSSVIGIHNGQLENYKEIQDKLLADFGIDQKGQTDTETAMNWLAFNKLSEFNKTFKGTWALILLNKKHKCIEFAVKDSPLYYCEGKLSSDASIFPKYYKIPNNSFGFIEMKDNNFPRLVLNGKVVRPRYTKNKGVKEKNIVGDKMLAEILEQGSIDYQLDKHGKQFLKVWLDGQYESVRLFGCGSSFHAGALGRKYFQGKNIGANIEYSSEYDIRHNNPRELKIGISQSGESLDTKEVYEKVGKKSLLVTNKTPCTIGFYAGNTINMGLSNEQAVAATKTFTATVLNLLSFARYISGDFDLSFEGKFKEAALTIFKDFDKIKAVAGKIKDFQHILVLGSDYQMPVASEIALKLKEVAQIHAEAQVAHEAKHGVISILNENVLSIFLLDSPKNERFTGHSERILGNASQIKARNGVLLGIGNQLPKSSLFDYSIEVPESEKDISPLLNNIIGQLLSYYLAKFKGINPDYCKNLSKAITVY